MQNTDAVRFRGVSFRYGQVRAVSDLDLTIPCGQTVALLGPNGAGKSTTIAMLLGLLAPAAGRVELFGTSPNAASTAGKVGAMLQETELLPRVTVAELLAFVRRLYPHPMPLDELVRLADLDGLLGRRLEKLSGGQSQRVKFAAAIAGRPDLLVLDEPTAAMDVESRHGFWRAMRRYAREGHTVLFSTHYVEEADESADRVVVVAGGRLIADGTPAAIRRSVATHNVGIAVPVEGTAGLDRLPAVTAVEIRGDRAYLSTDDADATVLALAASGLLHELEVRGARLEDAYLALTAGDGTEPILEGAQR
ncbi:ABC transporter ATP-binding protein [Actinocatenispora thailandica]|uniref:ABC transporter ATP-binding protein n=1 Tax=Actinocatenispora thailandica TaxID=227318 RepID=A0A7R7DJA5_9ACTN|nr:ABC transporter ATP-binding protein [Actinocatenispora thailandica]BCJ32540.1 ABC transporter ATP-binding protein [Actinocatenispora thailandica]